MMKNTRPCRVLVASPVHQHRTILEYFLEGLENLSTRHLELSFLFIDDNTEEDSKEVLMAFSRKWPKTLVLPSHSKTDYYVDETTHYWNEELVWKVARLKDEIIEYTLRKGYDALFLIDSDVVVHPLTLEQLQKAGKPIIANIFWTSWVPNSPELPQVWLQDKYSLFRQDGNEKLDNDEIGRRVTEFLTQLRKPGVYEVGGLGACTWIDRVALEKGVRFARIPNITLWGEDRHFCVRAMALGLPLHVDTHYPAYHIYRLSMVEGVRDYMNRVKGETEDFLMDR
ncbi:hypothetical protein [Pasteuria penetrans]|uniref:hypothetical protein n=1 Tax=Pasteuria penetrans TaxID=86005 RepID=UPI000F998C93|nr:hypothetical protein [Pasteuria penetrans]